MILNDGEALVREIWGIWNTPSLPLFSDPLYPGVVASIRVLPIGQIELFDIETVQTNDFH